MARFTDGHTVGPITFNWTTLAQLREIALAYGCTQAQFQHVTETMGASPDPIAVARYLKRRGFLPENFKLQEK